MPHKDSTYLGKQGLPDEILRRIEDDLLRMGMPNSSDIYPYKVRFENQIVIISAKGVFATVGEILSANRDTIRELPEVKGRVPYHSTTSHDTLIERVMTEAKAQASLAGAFHAVHRVKMSGPLQPLAKPKRESFIAFTAIPVLIQR
jgi:hypothetical protein